ncbi:MAG TPA: hypothetical protein VGJ25_14495 [Gaiellaceae bacterium]|jgi:hypothetical protein
MPPRAPHLYESLRNFCLGAFRYLHLEVDAGRELPFAFEEHPSPGRPALYEYRPLVRGYVEERARALSARDDARLAFEDLHREPAAAIFARAHAGLKPSEDEALFHSVLLPLIVSTAEGCGGFDWKDDVFERAYGELETALFRGRHAYAAIAPLVGLSLGTQVELGDGLRVRAAAAGELSSAWPEANGLLPAHFGREPDRLCVLELEHDLPPGSVEAPDASAELADAVTALRLATAGAIAAGPVLFERLDWRPYGIRPVLPIAGTQPDGEPTRLDRFRGRLAGDLRERLAAADEDPELGEALDRWELSLFQAEPFRAEQVRESLTALLGGTDGLWAASLRCAVLLGESARERAELHRALQGDSPDSDLLRRGLVEVLMHGNRAALIGTLDETLHGLRPRPAGYFAVCAAAS